MAKLPSLKARDSRLRSRKTEPDSAEPEAKGARLGNRSLEVVEALTDAGFNKDVIGAIMRRLEFEPVVRQKIGAYTNTDLINELESKIRMGLSYIDPLTFSNATLRDISHMIDKFIEKRNLLLGEPTAILTAKEREAIPSAVDRLLAETQRRGLNLTRRPDGSYGVDGGSGQS